jgi:hypothetical protein
MQSHGPGSRASRPGVFVVAVAALVALAILAPPAVAASVTLNSGVTPVTVTVPGRTGSSTAVLVDKKPYWGKPIGVSKWIGPDTNSGIGTGPNTTTTYEATFTLPPGFIAPALQVSVMADNAATVLVNGVQFGQQPQQDLAANYSVPSTFTTTAAQAAAFAAGLNTLTVRVFDTNGVTGLDFSATVGYALARDVSGVSLTGPATTPTGVTSLSLGSLPVGNLVIQRASPAQSAGVDEISTHRIGTARISTHRISTHRISTHRISTHRISTHRIAEALSTHRIGGDGLLVGTDLGAVLGNASLASLTLLRDGGWAALLRGTDLERALPQNTTFSQALHASPAVRELTDPTCDADPACDPVTMDEFVLDGSPLGDIPWIALLLQGVTWGDIAAPDGWCVDTAGQPIEGCPSLDSQDTILASVLKGVRLDATALGLRRVGDIAAAKRGPLLALSIADLNIAGTVLGDITPSQIAAGGGNVANVLTGTGYADLRAAAEAGAIKTTATFGDLGSTLDDVTLAAILLSFVDANDLPWEQLGLADAHLELLYPGRSATTPLNFVSEQLRFSLPCGEAATAAITLPAGFAYRPGSSQLTAGTGAPAAMADAVASGRTLTWAVPQATCAAGGDQATVIGFFLLPGYSVGSFALSGSVTAGFPGALAVSGSTTIAVTAAATAVGLPAQCPSSSPCSSGVLAVGQITSATDIDTYSLRVPAGKELTVTLSGLGYDADLVLYPPVGSQGARLLHGTAATPVPVGTVPLGQVETGEKLPPTAAQDIPIVPANASIAGLSSFRDLEPESISTVTVAGTGGDTTYRVQVDGYNGARGPEPYTVIVRVDDQPVLPPCAASPFAGANTTAGAALPSSIDPAVNTLFVVDASRMAKAYGAATASSILARLGDPGWLAAGVQGAVLPVDGSATVAAAFEAWDAKPCDVDRSNDVVRAIDDVIDSYKVGTTGWANLRNIVIVGDGTIIPHAALADGTTDTSERDFLSEALAVGPGQVAGASGRSMFLSDAPYGTFTPLSIQGQIAYIPQVALGRLGGSGGTVSQAIDRFLAAGGVADPGTASKTAFESDYDFFTDAGAATTATLTGLGYTVNRLTTAGALAPWSVAQFADGLLPAGGAARVMAINAHFDPSRMLAAKGLASGAATDLYTTANLAASPLDSMRLRVVYSIGCHFGLDVPDFLARAVPDWQETFQAKGSAVMIGNLGYGIGDTASVGFSERLMAGFTGTLEGGAQIGAGLVRAQQEYLRSRSMLNPYDLKAVQEVVLWGMPMYRLPGPVPAPAAGAAPGIETDPVSQLRSATLRVHPALQTVPTPDGRLYVTNGGVDQAVHPYPILPAAVLDVPAGAGLVAHGAVPLSWTIATLNVTAANAPNGYAFANATVDNAAAEPAPPSRTIFPTAFSNIGTTYAVDGSARQSLIVVPAQFRSATTGNPGFGQLREFTDASWLVTYAPASVTDFTGPQFVALSITEQGANTAVVADTSDPAGVARVLAQVLRGGQYQRVELTREPGTPGRWAGTVSGTDASPVQEATYFAIDANGNTASANNKGPGFIPLTGGAPGPATLLFTPAAPSASGWFLTQPSVAASGSGYRVQIDATGTPQASATVTDGVHTVFAIDPAGQIVNAVQVFVDTADPQLGTAPDIAVPATGPSGARVDYPLPTATDNVDPAPVVTCTPASGTTFPVGRTTVSCLATDRAGRTSSAQPVPVFDVDVTVDTTAPVVSATVTGPQGQNGWYTGNVTVAFAVVEPDSAVTSTGCATATVSADTPGTTFTCTATSLGGSQSATVTVKRDATAPVVTCPANATYSLGQVGATLTASVADLTSGAASSTVTGAVPTTVVGVGSVVLSATDNAGNSGSSRCSYLVGYGFAPPAGFLSPAPTSKWKMGQTVPIKIQLTGADGRPLSDAEANALVATSGCRLLFSAAGAQNLGATCMRYDAAAKQFIYNWKLGMKGTGAVTLTVTITYPGTTLTTTRSESITITT